MKTELECSDFEQLKEALESYKSSMKVVKKNKKRRTQQSSILDTAPSLSDVVTSLDDIMNRVYKKYKEISPKDVALGFLDYDDLMKLHVQFVSLRSDIITKVEQYNRQKTIEPKEVYEAILIVEALGIIQTSYQNACKMNPLALNIKNDYKAINHQVREIEKVMGPRNSIASQLLKIGTVISLIGLAGVGVSFLGLIPSGGSSLALTMTSSVLFGIGMTMVLIGTYLLKKDKKDNLASKMHFFGQSVKKVKITHKSEKVESPPKEDDRSSTLNMANVF